MAQQFTQGGVIYEDLGNGSVRVVGHVQQAGGPAVLGTPNPYTLPKDAAQLGQTIASTQRTQALLPTDLQKAALDAENTRLTNQKLTRDLAKPATPTEAEQSFAAKQGTLNSIVGQINRVDELYRAGPGATKGVWGVQDYFPTPSNQQFDSAAAGLGEQGMAAFRTPGVGTQSDADAARFVAANQPSAGAYDIANEEKLRQLRARVDANRLAAGLPKADWKIGGASTSTATNDVADYAPALAQPKIEVSRDGSGGSDPTKGLGIRTEVATLLQRGATKDEIEAYLKGQGVDPASVGSLDEALKFRETHPGYKGSYTVNPLDEKKEANWRGALSASPVGSAFSGAYNGMTAGFSDEIAGAASALTGGNYTESRDAYNAKKQLLAAANPTADLLGNVGGGALAMSLPGAGLTKLGVGTARTFAPAAIALDAGYGALYGAGENNQDRVGGAITGGLFGAAGGLGGRGLVRGLGAAVSPKGGGLGTLYENGIFPTLGQRFAGSGPLGRALNVGEQALQSVPGVGSLVARAREIPRTQFERGAFNQALGDIGAQLPKDVSVGTPAHNYMQGAFNDAYDAVRGRMQFVPDPQYNADLNAFKSTLNSGLLNADQAGRVEKLIDRAVTGRLQNGQLGGDAFKAASSELGKTARTLSASEPGMADALSSYATIFDDAARRASGPDASAALDAVDSGYAKAVRIEEAAAARGGDTGRFSPTQFDRSVQKTSGGVRSRAYLRGDALMGDYASAGKSLVDTLPNSGTADRLLTGQAAASVPTGAAGFALGIPTLLKAAPVFAPYLPGINKAVTRGMAPRSSAAAKAIGKAIKKQGKLGGMFAAPLGTIESQR